jgi:hypothetical protein
VLNYPFARTPRQAGRRAFQGDGAQDRKVQRGEEIREVEHSVTGEDVGFAVCVVAQVGGVNFAEQGLGCSRNIDVNLGVMGGVEGDAYAGLLHEGQQLIRGDQRHGIALEEGHIFDGDRAAQAAVGFQRLDDAAFQALPPGAVQVPFDVWGVEDQAVRRVAQRIEIIRQLRVDVAAHRARLFEHTAAIVDAGNCEARLTDQPDHITRGVAAQVLGHGPLLALPEQIQLDVL